MSVTKEWYRSEFVNHEMLEAHRTLENELSFYDAIANGMRSADITHFRDGTKRVTIKTPDKTMARSYGKNDVISPRMREVIEQTEQQRSGKQHTSFYRGPEKLALFSEPERG